VIQLTTMQTCNKLTKVQQELFDNINYLLKKGKVKSGISLYVCVLKGNTNYYASAIVKKNSVQYYFTSDKTNKVLTFIIQKS
jgi:hypothetical protein